MHFPTTLLFAVMSLAGALPHPASNPDSGSGSGPGPEIRAPATRVARDEIKCDIRYCQDGILYCHYWEPPSGNYDPLTGRWEHGGEVRKAIGECPP